jgi:hypothetical protein
MTLFWLTIAAVSILCGLALWYIPVTRCWMIGHIEVCTINETVGVLHTCSECGKRLRL